MNDWQIGMQMMARAPAPPYAPEQVTNRRADVENMLRTGKCSAILIASDLQMSLKYVHHILRTTPGVEVERIGRKSLYRLPA